MLYIYIYIQNTSTITHTHALSKGLPMSSRVASTLNPLFSAS